MLKVVCHLRQNRLKQAKTHNYTYTLLTIVITTILIIVLHFKSFFYYVFSQLSSIAKFRLVLSLSDMLSDLSSPARPFFT